MDFTNITGGLKIPSQIPLNVKEYCENETTLSYLGVNDNLAFTYHDQLIVTCLDEKTKWIWREVKPGEENTGLIPLDFTYPNTSIVFNVDYSNKTFNFFKLNYTFEEDVKEITSPNGTISVVETPTEIQLEVEETIANGSSTKIVNGDATIVTGTGTILDPYKINGKVYQEGFGITITGTGTTLNPYIISVDNSNGSFGWLQGDIKEVSCSLSYINNNFDNTGLGINERIGWAICNGNNGTPNDDGRVVIAYGQNYPSPGLTDGEVTHTLTESELPVIPPHVHNARVTAGLSGGYGFDGNNWDFGGGYYSTEAAGGFGGGQSHNNMQPYVVRLRIMKL